MLKFKNKNVAKDLVQQMGINFKQKKSGQNDRTFSQNFL